ncbi:MAG: pyridoxal phosphate-dependent aminotransferase [Acidimicrobiales bacterium]
MNRLRGFGTTIFAEMSGLADRTGAINLGQGYPDTDGPEEIKQAAIRAIEAGHNQYPPGPGIARLREAVAEHQRRFWGLDYDPDGEVLVTAGATEALAAALLAVCEPGDAVVLFEPWYDAYAAGVELAGATHRSVTLRADDGYAFDPAELADAVMPRTRAVVLNSPHNPTGKVFDERELAQVRDLCVEHDLVCITDEVYEHITFPRSLRSHVPIATLDGMRERTVTISSAAKTFSFTGWKVGWVCSTPALVAEVRTVKQFLTYVNAAPFQHAVAEGLEVLGDDYYTGLASDLEAKRDLLCAGLEATGFTVLPPDGTYFVTVDIRPLGYDDGLTFCRETLPACGVVAVPNVVFYDRPDEGRHLVRFAFCKRHDVLEEAVDRLKTL